MKDKIVKKNILFSDEFYAKAEKAFGEPRFDVVRPVDGGYIYDRSLISDGQQVFRIEVDEDGEIRFTGGWSVSQFIELQDGNWVVVAW